jgi:hypothetical protein
MSYGKTAALLLALLMSITACRQEEPPPAQAEAVLITFAVQPPTLVVGEALLLIGVVEDETLNAVEVSRLTVRGDMDHAGMVPVIAESTGGEGGQFEIPFQWTMGGDWIVEVTAELADGRTVTETFNVTISAEGGDMLMPEATEEAGN